MSKPEYNFKRGKSGNPNGRPKGAYSPLRKQLIELRKRAADDADVAYNILWDDFTNGETAAKQLAKQIYFKELVSIPKEWLSEVNTKDIPKEIKTFEDINSCITHLTETLLHADSMSVQEVLELLKILNSIITNASDNRTNRDEYTREQAMARINKVAEYLDKEGGKLK